jgi:hypothetical protein
MNLAPQDGERTVSPEQPTTTATPASSFWTAERIAQKAASLVGGDRQATHGDKAENHQNIADLWNAYLGGRLPLLTARDVALMMALLKIARTKIGQHNIDDYLDLAGYGAVAGEIAERERHDR